MRAERPFNGVMANTLIPGPRDCLLVIDVQSDFCAGGSLAVPDADSVVPVINAIMPCFQAVILTQDQHPADHISFVAQHPGKECFDTVKLSYGDQVLWPPHCVIGSRGAAFHPELDIAPARLVLRKGFRREIDSYSAFFENDRTTPTGLAGYLRECRLQRLVLCGLATDFCVFWTAKDAISLGFDVVLIDDACRAIDQDGSRAKALTKMQDIGVWRLSSEAIIHPAKEPQQKESA